MLENNVVIYRLILSAILGGLIGAEREMNKRPAGLRTHLLVTTGACLMMIVSMGNTGGDQFRLAAQVVSGVGFLGAGTIMQKDNVVGGLTTAASIWTTAGIGLAVGFGYYLAAIVTAFIVLFALLSLTLYEKVYWGKDYNLVEITYNNEYGMFEALARILRDRGLAVKGMYFFGEFNIQDGERIVKYKVRNFKELNQEKLKIELLNVDGVKKVKIVPCTMDRVREEQVDY